MKKVLVIAGIASLVAILGVAVLGAVALAQDGDDGPFNLRERFHEIVAEILGVPVSDYDQALVDAQEQVLDEAVTEGFLTEEQAQRMQERFGDGDFPEMMGPRGMFPRGGKGGMPFGGMRGAPDGNSLDAVAEALGLTTDELKTELEAGKSIAAVAEEKGVDVATITDAYVEQMSEHLAQAVEDGKMTQDQVDSMLENARARFQDMLDQTWDMHPTWDKGGLRRFGHESLDVAAEALGMTTDDLLAELQDGKSIAAVAEEKGVGLDTIIDAYVAQESERLARAVEDGKITQDQADSMLEKSRERIQEMMDQTWDEGGFHRFGHEGRPGRFFEDLPDQNDA